MNIEQVKIKGKICSPHASLNFHDDGVIVYLPDQKIYYVLGYFFHIGSILWVVLELNTRLV
jgi:hypothetical protein